MNLEKLFNTQKELSNRILEAHPELRGQDLFNKKVLALLVELGECANEYRAWKFWSKDQKPRTHKARHPYMDADDADFYNPLLEEYVDCLHFVLELGIELNADIDKLRKEIELEPFYKGTLTEHFNMVFKLASRPVGQYRDLFNAFVGLGEFLGFEWREVEQAYFVKNQINHQRQETGY
jgi:dimeric dUTPase (all-alpha-NTP-PPase superfamily)